MLYEDGVFSVPAGKTIESMVMSYKITITLEDTYGNIVNYTFSFNLLSLTPIVTNINDLIITDNLTDEQTAAIYAALLLKNGG